MLSHPFLSWGVQAAPVDPPIAGGGGFVKRPGGNGRGGGRAWSQRTWSQRETIVEPGQTDQDYPTDGGI